MNPSTIQSIAVLYNKVFMAFVIYIFVSYVLTHLFLTRTP